MWKFILFLVVVGAVLKFTPLGNYVWANTISVINPAAKEEKVLGQLKTQLNSISSAVSQSSFAKTSEGAKIKGLISQAGATLNDAQSIAKQSDVTAAISNVIQKIIPSSNSSAACKP